MNASLFQISRPDSKEVFLFCSLKRKGEKNPINSCERAMWVEGFFLVFWEEMENKNKFNMVKVGFATEKKTTTK